MYRAALLTTTALVALSASNLLAALHAATPQRSSVLQAPQFEKTKILYNQNSNDAGYGISSMNFSSNETSILDDQAADDFVIPKGKGWTITEIDVSGVYYEGSGPATNENVIFYRNANGLPGKPIAKGTFNNLQGVGDRGSFSITLPNGGLRLKAGHYWVSVIANMLAEEAGNWGWKVNSMQHGDQAAWRNPQGGFGIPACRSWNTFENCFGTSADLMFQLKGETR